MQKQSAAQIIVKFWQRFTGILALIIYGKIYLFSNTYLNVAKIYNDPSCYPAAGQCFSTHGIIMWKSKWFLSG